MFSCMLPCSVAVAVLALYVHETEPGFLSLTYEQYNMSIPSAHPADDGDSHAPQPAHVINSLSTVSIIAVLPSWICNHFSHLYTLYMHYIVQDVMCEDVILIQICLEA